jgi:PAS domain S-box-containing protein
MAPDPSSSTASPAPADARRALRLALTIGAVYAVVGGLWILLSDAAVLAVSEDPGWRQFAQRWKGLAYVLTTALALVLLIRFGARRLLRVASERQALELQVQDLFQRHPQPMWVFDRQTLAFLRVNEAALRQYGYSEAEFLHMTAADIRPPEDVAHLQQVLRASQPSTRVVGVMRHRRKSGELLYAHITSQPVPWGDHDAALVMAIDVTAEEEAKAALLRQERQYALLHQSLAEVLWLASADGRQVLYVSPAFAKLYGRSVDDYRQDPDLWLKQIHPDDRARADAASARLFSEGEVAVDYRIVRPDGSVRWVSDRRRVLRGDDGLPQMIGGIAEDITQARADALQLRAQAAELVQRNAELERFNRATVGRELDMIALKREVNALRARLQLEPLYRLPDEPPP